MTKQSVKMKINGMTCFGCEDHVVKALEQAGAKEISASFRKGEVEFRISEHDDPSVFTQAVEKIGYQMREFESLVTPSVQINMDDTDGIRIPIIDREEPHLLLR